MNKVLLIGYLANDPKQRITAKGIEQATFSLGVTDIRNYNDSYFFQCVAWNNQAKYINTNLKKGALVSIDGRLTRRSYIDSEGKTVYLTEVIVDNIKNYHNNRPSNNISNTTSIIEESMLPHSTVISEVLEVDEPQNEDTNNIESNITFDWEKDLE